MKRLVSVLRDLHTWDVAVSASIAVVGTAMMFRVFPGVHPFWAIWPLYLGLSMLIGLVLEERERLNKEER